MEGNEIDLVEPQQHLMEMSKNEANRKVEVVKI